MRKQKENPIPEAKRVEFEQMKEKMLQQGYEAKEVTVGAVKANVMA